MRNARQRGLSNIRRIHHSSQWCIARNFFHGSAIAARNEISWHRRRRHAIHPDFRAKHARKRHRHRVKRGLGGTVCDVTARSRECRDRRYVDDAASPTLAQERREFSDDRERATHIGDQHSIKEIVVERREIGVRNWPGEPGGINQNIGPTVFLGYNLFRGSNGFHCLKLYVQRTVTAAGKPGNDLSARCFPLL